MLTLLYPIKHCIIYRLPTPTETFNDIVAVHKNHKVIGSLSTSNEPKGETLTVLKLGKRLRGEDPLSLKGMRCLRSS